MWRIAYGALALVLASANCLAAETVWPEKDWTTATPRSQGMDQARLDQAVEYALKHGGGSGCIIRHGYLVSQWGPADRRADTKSCAKGSVGTTILGLALDEGLIRLEDRAQAHYPQIGRERPENIASGWLERITVHHLATMTAGFDDGRPPRLMHEPGRRGIYSNDCSNMLAELLTLKFEDDLASVLKKRVMDVIGADPKDWAWRQNSYRPRTVGAHPSREFASGITITHGALARIGYLYLRQGMWKDQRVLSREFVELATRPTELPAPWPYYGFYWGTNGRGTYGEIPQDAYWAMGLGDSFVVVCPSLDIVAVRLGTGSKASQLPGGGEWDDWGARVQGFFRLVVQSVTAAGVDANPAARPDEPPYPPSPVIGAIQWDRQIIRQADGSDNFPVTWADDDALYSAYGDGWGFAPKLREKLSLGFVRVTGSPPDFRGEDIRSPSGERKGDGRFGGKASGMLMVDGVLYMWMRNAGNSQLGWSTDHARSWTFADWRFTESFGCPTFLNFGRNYAGARDEYVYIYSQDHDSAYLPADRFVMARVHKDHLRERSAYEFLQSIDGAGQPVWTADLRQRGAVFAHTGRCYRSGITYNPGLKRYLWVQIIPGGDTRFEGGFGIYDAPEPWGPWTTAFYTSRWDTGPGESASLPTKWISEDGRAVHLLFSGNDCFSVRRGIIGLRE
jgi:CubicO group peptidase (beta-lactamase class C family)